jgi:small subunit ribosomal protein S21
VRTFGRRRKRVSWVGLPARAARDRQGNRNKGEGLKVIVKDQQEFEQALREFRRKVQEQGLVREMRRRAHYVPPAEARKIKSLRARRRRSR